jgi:hypothetical protein
MTSPRMTAKERADRAPVASLFRTNDTHPTGRTTYGLPYPNDIDPAPSWTLDGWKTDPRCAIVGPCLTGAHTTPEPEPVP